MGEYEMQNEELRKYKLCTRY